jgi:hypothetical protein
MSMDICKESSNNGAPKSLESIFPSEQTTPIQINNSYEDLPGLLSVSNSSLNDFSDDVKLDNDELNNNLRYEKDSPSK